MLSVLVLGSRLDASRPSQNSDVVRTLATLVPVAVEGLVRDVCLLAGRNQGELRQIADHAGCGFVEAQTFAEAIRGGAQQARCARILVAQAGMMLDRGFIDEMAELIPSARFQQLDAFRLKAEAAGLAGRLFPAMAPDAALLASRESLQGCKAESFRGLVQALRPKHRLQSKARLAA